MGSMFASIPTGPSDYAKVPDELKFPNLQISEIVKELNLFYSEGANGPVPIVLALRYVRRKAAGDTPEQLQTLLSTIRRLVSAPPH